MSAALYLANADDLTVLQKLVADYHAEIGLEQSEDACQNALLPLLQDSSLGAIYLIGPRRGPVGYLILSFIYSVRMGGVSGVIDEFFIRPNVRGRGVATEVLHKLIPALAGSGLQALQLEIGKDHSAARRLYARLGFHAHEGCHLLSRQL